MRNGSAAHRRGGAHERDARLGCPMCSRCLPQRTSQLNRQRANREIAHRGDIAVANIAHREYIVNEKSGKSHIGGPSQLGASGHIAPFGDIAIGEIANRGFIAFWAPMCLVPQIAL